MKNRTSFNPIRIKHQTAIFLTLFLIVFAIATPALADFLGPDRTITETTSVCEVVLLECQFISSKNIWKYHRVGSWSCSDESKPWKKYSDTPSSQGCFDATKGDNYWAKEEVLKEVVINHPPATINNSLQNCNMKNGWCTSSPELLLVGVEPLSGYSILAIEGSLNGQTFACSGNSCSIPLIEGSNTINFWALSSWGDSSEMGSFTNQVDSVPPTLGLDITASNGTNGWYTSPAFLAATGSDSTSGLANILLSVDNGAWVPSTILNEGVYNVDVKAEDNAGNISNTTTTILVDTTTPSIDLSLNGTEGKSGWYISDTQLSASASDATSGVEKLEVLTDGGVYTTYTSSILFSDGWHTIQFKATDNAGNQTETPSQTYFIDTIAPKVALPAAWEVNETVEFSVQDDGSGLSELRVVIEDEDEKYAKIVWIMDVSGSKFKDEITWDGKFKDGTVAPPGEYLVWIKSGDKAGNEHFALGIITVPSPFSLFQSIPLTISHTRLLEPPQELFEYEAIPVQNNSSPTVTYGNTTSQQKEAESRSFSVSQIATGTAAARNTNSSVLWGATAAAVISAATAYALDEQRKRKEDEARQAAQVQAEVDVKNAALEASRQAKWEAQKVQGWLEGQEIKKAQALADELSWLAQADMTETEKLALHKATPNYQTYAAHMTQWQQNQAEIRRLEQADMTEAERLAVYKASDEYKAYQQRMVEWQAEQNAKNPQVGLAAHYIAMKQGEQMASQSFSSSQTNWWEKTKAFVYKNVIQPVNASVYQPYIKPELERKVEAYKSDIAWLNENLYKPVVKPSIKTITKAVEDYISWWDVNIYQPATKPIVKAATQVATDYISFWNENFYQPLVEPTIKVATAVTASYISWWDENLFQPLVKPVLETATEIAAGYISWWDETLYQPYIQPAIDKNQKRIADGISWLNNNIYQPVFQPVVSDINKYIYQPLANTTGELWDRYGEWVHGSLDAVGFIPGLGEIADGLNGLIYLGEGRYIEAAVSAVAMIPLLGDLGKAGKWTVKAGQEILEEAVEKVAKETAENIIEKTVKKAAGEIAEKAIKETGEELAAKVTRDALEAVAEETAEKAVVETAQKLGRKATNEVGEALSSKIVAESFENAATKATKEKAIENIVQKTADDAIAKTVKNTTETVASAGTEKLSKEVKDVLVKKALEKADDKSAALVRSVAENIGDDVASINKAVALVQNYGDDAIKVLKAVEPEAAAKVLQTVDKNILDDVIQQGPDAIAAFSGWTEKELKEHGRDLAARASKDAEVLNDVKTLISKGPIDPKNLTDEQKFLIEKIAANSTFNADGTKVVVGKWTGLDGGFLGRAKETGSLHYSPHPDLWELFGKLENQNEVAWLVNEQIIQNGITKGLSIEYTLDGVNFIDNEMDAIEAVFSGQTEEKIMELLDSKYLPVRMKELQTLQNAGYMCKFESASNSYILIKP